MTPPPRASIDARGRFGTNNDGLVHLTDRFVMFSILPSASTAGG